VAGEDARAPAEAWLPWLLAVIFWLCAFPFYGLISWLAAALVEGGWDPVAAGTVVACISLAGLPGSMLIGSTADRLGSRRRSMIAWAAVMTVATAGFVVRPDLALVWAIIDGLAIGATFTLSLILPLDVARDPQSAVKTIAIVLSVGYVLTAGTPLLLGVMRDITGSFEASLILLVAVSALVIPASLPLTRARLNGH
jgi:MFS transporter, CP family, cyanate transporter